MFTLFPDPQMAMLQIQRQNKKGACASLLGRWVRLCLGDVWGCLLGDCSVLTMPSLRMCSAAWDSLLSVHMAHMQCSCVLMSAAIASLSSLGHTRGT